jgi:hypothetical protein
MLSQQNPLYLNFKKMQENSQIKSKTSPDQFERVSISIIGILLPKKHSEKLNLKRFLNTLYLLISNLK